MRVRRLLRFREHYRADSKAYGSRFHHCADWIKWRAWVLEGEAWIAGEAMASTIRQEEDGTWRIMTERVRSLSDM